MPNYEEYSLILGSTLIKTSCTPLLNQGFRLRMSKFIGIKSQGVETNKCTLDFLCNLFLGRDAYNRIQPIFKSSHEKWNLTQVLALEFAILGHVIFPRNLEGFDIGLLHFREQIERGNTFVHMLLAGTIKALCTTKTTRSTYFECYVLLLQI